MKRKGLRQLLKQPREKVDQRMSSVLGSGSFCGCYNWTKSSMLNRNQEMKKALTNTNSNFFGWLAWTQPFCWNLVQVRWAQVLMITKGTKKPSRK